jgi:threonine aldolase
MNDQIIDLRSDTITRPTPEMLQAMHGAKTGDDVFAEDPITVELQERCAALFGHEAALYCPSGTMTNQIAINVHVRPGDEVICDRKSHIYNYEGGGIARNSGASVRLLEGNNGRFIWSDVEKEINPSDSHYSRSSLVSVEDTCNRGGGSVWNMDDLRGIQAGCARSNLPLHLDGARVWNAVIARNENKVPSEEVWRNYGQTFDSISICFSKGLGAPVGSVLIGNRDFIAEAHRTRKVLGGGMRQIGGLAAACMHALDCELPRMNQDHFHAQALAKSLEEVNCVESIEPVETNIVIFSLKSNVSPVRFVKWAEKQGISCFPFGGQKVRFVTHRDVSQEHIERACKILGQAEL